MNIQTTTILNNDVEMPVFGLGTYKIPDGKPVIDSVTWALEHGYRHVDTAARYHNEGGVGKAIAQSDLEREDVFVTTKLWNDDHDDPRKALNESLDKLGMDYVDLWLMHWPVEGKRNDTWEEMIELYEEGKCRAIGVSNFTIRHLKELLDETDVVPAVNQVEFHPFLYQKSLLEFCESQDIQLEAYSPLTKARRLDNPVIKEVADKYGKSPAQVLIRWGLQHDLVVIPKSQSHDHIVENSEVFDFVIKDEDMEKLNDLNEDEHLTWDPTDVS